MPAIPRVHRKIGGREQGSGCSNPAPPAPSKSGRGWAPGEDQRMYGPAISDARPLRYYDMGSHVGVLLGELSSAGFVEYLFVLAVSPINDENNPLYVTAEKNHMEGALPGIEGDGGSHFLCSFEGGVHCNFGSSDDWADVEKFEARALQ